MAIHGRTREQYYSGKADLQVIADVKKAVKIPVIGNGDICDVESAIRMYEVTGCDGIMVGRAARGNPWIFRQLSEYFENGRIIAKPGRNEVIDMILRHCRMLIEEKGEYTGIREMRKHVGWYTFGMPHSASIRGRVNTLESYDELEDMFNELRQ